MSDSYQIRLLVKAYNFVDSRDLEVDLLEVEQPLESIRLRYLERIRHVLAAAIRWLVNTDFNSSRLLLGIGARNQQGRQGVVPIRQEDCERARADASFDQDYNRSCYATIAVWYVMKHCPLAVSDNFKTDVLAPKLALAYESVQHRATKDKSPTPKNDILQWYHMSTLYLICCQPFGKEKHAFHKAGIGREDLLRTQQRFQKYASRLKASKAEYYSSDHEELDRVVLLGEELDFQSIGDEAGAAAQVASRLKQTQARLEARRRTPRFNHGLTAWNSRHEPLYSPWELLCTNHELYLRTGPERSVESVRNRVFEFMNSDYSFMASWDTSDGDMIAKWWDFEPNAIVCATILDLKFEGRHCIYPSHSRRSCTMERPRSLSSMLSLAKFIALRGHGGRGTTAFSANA